MKLKAEGIINHRIHAIGTPHYPAYVVRGDSKTLMIEAGINLFGPLYLQHLTELLGSPEKLDYIFVTHSHFDHLGSLDYLKRMIPGLKAGGFPRINELAAKESVISMMNRMSGYQKAHFAHLPGSLEDLTIRPFSLDIELHDGDEIDLGGITCRVIHTPGHTRDSLSYYIPELSTVFPGECAGVPARGDTDDVLAVFLTSFEDYIESTEKIMALGADTLCLAHGLVYKEDSVLSFLQRSLKASHDYKAMINFYLVSVNNDPDAAVRLITSKEYDEKGIISQERNAYIANLSAQVRLLRDPGF